MTFYFISMQYISIAPTLRSSCESTFLTEYKTNTFQYQELSNTSLNSLYWLDQETAVSIFKKDGVFSSWENYFNLRCELISIVL